VSVSLPFKYLDKEVGVFWADRPFNANNDFPIIMGRTPLFDKFDIEFKGNKKVFLRKA
jgi:hypothetical protein